MPLYMDIHKLPEGTSPDDIAQAHYADLRTQGKYDVEYVKYWSNHECGKLFCLVHAPDAESAQEVHREAHGLTAEKIIEVPPELAESFLGGGELNQAGATTLPGAQNRELDTGIRTVLHRHCRFNLRHSAARRRSRDDLVASPR